MHKWQNSIMNKNINKRVAELRLHLRKNGLAAYIFPSTDPHHSEYPPEHWKTRERSVLQLFFRCDKVAGVGPQCGIVRCDDSRPGRTVEAGNPFPCFPMFGRVFAMVRVCAGENIGGQSVFP